MAKWRHPLCVWEQLSIGTSRVAHGSKLDELEKLVISAGSLLSEQDRAPELRANQTPERQTEGREHGQSRHC
jgi:hypothetical protein